MKLVLVQLLLAGFILVAYAADLNETSLNDDETEWQDFLEKYRNQNGVLKTQSNYDFATRWFNFDNATIVSIFFNFRKQLFMARLHVLRDHNKNFQDGKVTWEMGINQFSDYVSF